MTFLLYKLSTLQTFYFTNFLLYKLFTLQTFYFTNFLLYKLFTLQTFYFTNFLLFVMTINELQDNIIEEFSMFDDWMDKYALLIDLGNSLEPLDEKQKNPQNIIEGCQSRVWLDASLNNGIITYQGESDAVLVKGLVSLLIQVMSGHTPDEILDSELYFIDKIGLKEHLSPTRSNGLLAMVKQMKMFALAYKSVKKLTG